MGRLAAIDVGTNTILLLVAEVNERGEIFPLREEQIITRLGKDLEAYGNLRVESIRDSLAVLKKYQEISRSLGAERIIACGTSALREATNQKIFLTRAEEELGLRVEILSGEQEAQWAFRGALSNKKNLPGKILLTDIGGGSTEFIWGESAKIEGLRSLPIGSVRMTERFIHSDPINAEDYRALCRFVRGEIDHLKTELRPRPDHLIGTAGTITTLAAMDQQMATYHPEQIDGYILSKIALRGILRELKRKSLAERQKIPGLEPKRADIILAGAAILNEIMEDFGWDKIMVSERGLRYGLVLRELEKIVRV